MLGMGYVILLWHSLSLPYNYFKDQSPPLLTITVRGNIYSAFINLGSENEYADCHATLLSLYDKRCFHVQGVQHRMVLVVNVFVLLQLLLFTLLLIYMT